MVKIIVVLLTMKIRLEIGLEILSDKFTFFSTEIQEDWDGTSTWMSNEVGPDLYQIDVEIWSKSGSFMPNFRQLNFDVDLWSKLMLFC